MKYAIIVKMWNRDEVMFFNNLPEAVAEWEKIGQKRNAHRADKGNTIIVSDPRQRGVGFIYSRIVYKKTW